MLLWIAWICNRFITCWKLSLFLKLSSRNWKFFLNILHGFASLFCSMPQIFMLKFGAEMKFDFPFEGNIWCHVPRWPMCEHIRSIGGDTESSEEEENSDLRWRATAARGSRQRRNHAQTQCRTTGCVCSCNRWRSCKELIRFSQLLFWEAFF